MPQSKTIERDEALAKERKTLDYDDAEKDQMSSIYRKLTNSHDQMNQPMDEHDGKSLLQDCQSSRLAASSFLTPIMNDGEVRVVTGTTEGKLDTVFNSVFNQNLEPEVRIFNEWDIEDIELGETLTKVVKRTGQIEKEQDFYQAALKEMLSQPAVFIQETNQDEWFYDRVLESGEWSDLWSFVIPKFSKQKYHHKREARKVMWTVDQVFLADHRIPARLFHTQAYYITYRIRSVEEAEKIYGKSPRWDYVNPGAVKKDEANTKIETSEWRFSSELQNNQIEEIVYKSIQDDEFQVILNGVNMVPVGCPVLSTRFKKPDMTMQIMKEIHSKYAYGRSLVAMAKTLQGLKDESFRLAILENRQRIWQPIVTKAQTILSKDMWLPSAITYGIDKDDIQSLLDERQGDPSSSKMISDMIDGEIEAFMNISNILQGLDQGQQTAQEVQIRMRQALINLGHALTSYMRMIRDCSYMRVYNIINEFTQPIGERYSEYAGEREKVYRTFTLADADLFDGKIGDEIISFVGRNLLDKERKDVLKLEERSNTNGRRSKRFTFVPVDRLRLVPWLIYIDVVAKEKRTSGIEREIHKKDLVDSIKFGQAVGMPINGEYATQEWGKRVDIDARKLYTVPTEDVLLQNKIDEADRGAGGSGKNPIDEIESPKFGAKQVSDESAPVANPSAK